MRWEYGSRPSFAAHGKTWQKREKYVKHKKKLSSDYRPHLKTYHTSLESNLCKMTHESFVITMFSSLGWNDFSKAFFQGYIGVYLFSACVSGTVFLLYSQEKHSLSKLKFLEGHMPSFSHSSIKYFSGYLCMYV